MDLSPTCLLCAADVFHCHEVSVRHTDGSSSCGDPWCTLPHHLHEWQEVCGAPGALPCACTRTADPAGVVVAVPRAQAGRRYTDTWWSLAS